MKPYFYEIKLYLLYLAASLFKYTLGSSGSLKRGIKRSSPVNVSANMENTAIQE